MVAKRKSRKKDFGIQLDVRGLRGVAVIEIRAPKADRRLEIVQSKMRRQGWWLVHCNSRGDVGYLAVWQR